MRQTLFRKGDDRRGLIGANLAALSRNSTVMQSGKVINYKYSNSLSLYKKKGRARAQAASSLFSTITARSRTRHMGDHPRRVRSAVVAEGKLTAERKSCESSVSVESAATLQRRIGACFRRDDAAGGAGQRRNKKRALEIVSPRADRTTVMSLLSKIAFNSRYGGLISAKAGRVAQIRPS